LTFSPVGFLVVAGCVDVEASWGLVPIISKEAYRPLPPFEQWAQEVGRLALRI